MGRLRLPARISILRTAYQGRLMRRRCTNGRQMETRNRILTGKHMEMENLPTIRA